jgi:hypothetical protein
MFGKERSGAALRKDFDFGELRCRRSARNRERFLSAPSAIERRRPSPACRLK